MSQETNIADLKATISTLVETNQPFQAVWNQIAKMLDDPNKIVMIDHAASEHIAASDPRQSPTRELRLLETMIMGTKGGAPTLYNTLNELADAIYPPASGSNP